MGFDNMGPEVKIMTYARKFSMYNTTIQQYNNTTIQKKAYQYNMVYHQTSLEH